MNHWYQHTGFRLSLAAGYLLAVNLVAGWLAEALGYPSLWGNRSGIFGEYALPLPFTWALAHWPTMLIGTFLVAGLPMWERRLVVRGRWIAAGILLAGLAIELSDGINRFQKIPFVLFPMVDAGLFLVLAFCFHPPLRTLIATGGITLVALGAWYLPSLTATNGARDEKPAQPLIEDVELVVDHAAGKASYFFALSAVIHPDDDDVFDAVCDVAEASYPELLASDPPPADMPAPDIQFMARAWFDAPASNIYHPAGRAYQADGGPFICLPVFPFSPD